MILAEAVHHPSHFKLYRVHAQELGGVGRERSFERPSPCLPCRVLLRLFHFFLVQCSIHGITKTNQTATFLPASIETFKHRSPAFEMSIVKQSVFSALRHRLPFTTRPRSQFDFIQTRI